MIPFRCNSRNLRTTASLTLFLLFVTTARSELFVASFNGNRIHRYSETNGAAIGTGVFQGANNHIYKTDSRGLLSTFLPNVGCYGLMFDQRGRLIACQTGQRRIIAIDIASKAITVLATNFNGVNFSAPNDLIVDSANGVYFTDPHGSGPNESVYYVNTAGVVSQVASNMANPNGVILSPDERTLYVLPGGTPPRMMSFPVLSPGVVGPGVTNFIPRGSDGMAVDTQGNLYICQFGSVNQILVRAPSGQTLGSITFPEQPSNCTFGGTDMKTLFVTAGTSLYTCRMQATGHRFAWNPTTYFDFQRKFFGATNAPSSTRADDPDGDGASNELEYLTRTHPLDSGDPWRIGISNLVGMARISFPQAAARGFEVQHSLRVGSAASWQTLTSLPIFQTNRTAIVSDPIDTGTNRFYRVRVSEP
jgi:gluconolactonase